MQSDMFIWIGHCFLMFLWEKSIINLDKCLNMFAANPRFARGESRISFDMLKSLRRVLIPHLPGEGC